MRRFSISAALALLTGLCSGAVRADNLAGAPLDAPSAGQLKQVLSNDEPATNSRPWIVTNNVVGRVGKPLSYRLEAYDSPEDVLTFKIVGGALPPGLILDEQTGVVSGTPQQMGAHQKVTFQANDGSLDSDPTPIDFSIIETGNLVVNSTGAEDDYDTLTTLKEAITAANEADPKSKSTITFDLPPENRAITLTEPLPAFISRNTEVVGPTSGGGVSVQRSTAAETPAFRIFFVYGGRVRLANLTIKNGDAMGMAGGGIYVEGGGGLTVENCTIANNIAGVGGGIYATSLGPTEGGLNLINSTITGNVSRTSSTVLGGGGGLGFYMGVVNIESCTIVGNTGVYAGGFEIIQPEFVRITVHNSIVAGNTSTDTFGDSTDIYGHRWLEPTSLISAGHNLVGSDTTGIFTSWDSDPIKVFTAAGDKVGVKTADLRLGELADDGAPTPTMALQPGSIAIDAGDTDLTTDQRGLPRPTGSADDIGAVEARSDLKLSVESVTLSPQAPLRGQPIKAEVVASATNGKAFSLRYSWAYIRKGKTYKQTATGDTLDTTNIDLRRGDKVIVTVVARQEASQSAPVTASVDVANTAIAIAEMRLQPRSPYVSETLIATARTTDRDKTVPFYTYVWKRNGTVTRTVTGSRNSQDNYDLRVKGRGAKGDVIEVTVTASDGESTANASATATIRNSVPVVTSLSLAPQAPKPTGTVISTYAGRDADGDTLTKIYKWRIGNKVLANENGSRLDLSKYPFVKAGDVVSVELRLFDGEATSKALTAKVTVAAPAAAPAIAPSLGTSAASS